MGEYLNHSKLGDVKIGTCENLYYTTFQQFTEEVEKGNFIDTKNAEEYLEPNTFRFRFPFPDEKLEIGTHEDYDRGVSFKVLKSHNIEIGHDKRFHRLENENGALGFELPCIQSDEFPVKVYDWSNTKDFTIFEIVQQKLVDEETGAGLQTVVRCPYCNSKSRLSKEEADTLLHYTETHPTLFTDLQKEIAAIASEGYNYKLVTA